MTQQNSSSIIPISPESIFVNGYELSDQNLIPNKYVISSFIPYQDTVELWVYDSNNNLIGGETDFSNYFLTPNPQGDNANGNTSIIELDPITDVLNLGFDNGIIKSVYNFIRYELNSSPSFKYYLSEISSDRTEIRLKSNLIENIGLESTYAQFKSKLDSTDYFDEFYIDFGNNQYQIGINIELDKTTSQYSILVKLYDALPLEFGLKDEVVILTKTAESYAYQIEFTTSTDTLLDITYIKGPNTNLNLNDFVNNSTEFKSKEELLATNSSESLNNLSSILSQKGVKITPNYSYDTFNEFVNFSSAKKRIENFIEKLDQIQAYESDIEVLSTISGETSSSFQVSSSIASAHTNIKNIITNFDGYEYYLYYNTGSFSYPKTGSQFPYTLLPTNDPTVITWLGSDDENSDNFGGILLSSSLYDNNNQNWLYYTIPEFIRDNDINSQYVDFSNMVGQHFDEIWLYTKAVSEKNNTISDLDSGIPLDLTEKAIASLGYSGFGSNYNNQNNYIGLSGENNKNYTPPTGSELITNYIAVNGGQIANYWALNYSYEYYVEQLNNPGFPYAIDAVNKEIFKRLYHNMSYLVKKKGTISGLRQLINIWGIPDTILRINEFGGKNKDNSDDYDLWYNRYSYAFSPISNQNLPSASVLFPWLPLERNHIVDNDTVVPDSIQFRFKTTGYPSSTYAGDFYTQSLLVKKSDGDGLSNDFDFGIALFYTGSTSGSYSGSTSSDYADWGIMRFYLSKNDGSDALVSDDIYLPFFDKGWWSVMLQRDKHNPSPGNDVTYTLYVKNKTYNGFDGNSIGFEGSSSIVANDPYYNGSWMSYSGSEFDGIYLGGYISGSLVGGNVLNVPGKMFSGSLQEFRYYSSPISESIFNDFVMNPESIEGINITGSLSSFDILNFRAPLGNELESMFTSSLSSSYNELMSSFHPAVSTSADILNTQSFFNPTTGLSSSEYSVIYYENQTTKTYSKTNSEIYFLDQPAAGVRNRINNKIQIEDGNHYGNTLSSIISIDQNYQISQSFTEDITSLEVAFSPENQINDDIIQTLGYSAVQDTLGDPRFISESADYYPHLRDVAEDYFKKYSKGNVYDYLRLIKYFDNSIFKAIKNYVPARTSVSTGIIIKQHLLERNRYPQPRISEVTKIATTPSGGLNTPINVENLELTSSMSVGSFDGGSGGSVEKFNYSGSPVFGELLNTQSWVENVPTNLGLVSVSHSQQDEFYNGEYSGSETIATTQSLFNNPYLTSGSSSLHFENTDYYALTNNYNDNRQNLFLMDIDYNNGPNPFNLDAIRNGNATHAQTPDSNYTAKKVIIPRYEGSKVTSLDYNNYTTASSNAQFLDGTTGSWGGDISYGKTSTINKNPIYFAHFKTSQVNPAIFNTIEYTIDALIEVPFQTLSSQDLRNLEPKTLKVEGSNNRLQEVISTFEKDRKVKIAYTSPSYNGVNWNSLKTGNFTILNPGSEYIVKSTNQITETETSPTWSFDRFTNQSISGSNIYPVDGIYQGYMYDYNLFNIDTSSLNIGIQVFTTNSFNIAGLTSSFSTTPSYLYNGSGSGAAFEIGVLTSSSIEISVLSTGSGYKVGETFTFSSQSLGAQTGGGTNLILSISPSNLQHYGNDILMVTGSGYLILSGSYLNDWVFFTNPNHFNSGKNGFMGYKGSYLPIIHTYNYCLKNDIIFNPSSSLYYAKPFGVSMGPLEKTFEKNYFRFNFSSSLLPQYNNVEEKFLIERGDEIRITYNSPNANTHTQEFSVLGVEYSVYSNGYHYAYVTGSMGLIKEFSYGEVPIVLYDKILVSPDPSTLNIPNGEIYNYTIRKRQNADDKIMIISSPPSGSNGAVTPSGEGYLIPKDLTFTQNANTLQLINKLKSMNAFRNDDNKV